ncbi:putative glyoxalase superfamily protein PhnB [Dysgonomonas alginatilytica]|uniref:Putative glyoxalase superfamily protein PhnB n=1 Tax=Dysgonomonas alginatilytica TaxID=1605892 RepID=A0A2V3PNB4_9BACT|nr:VOC family protein [Dysgonomonas alginatilytica]PXV63838.1 putative glyoxalase superfamily protein PhnB [Dysgonomonas alginatilytica]
MVLKDSTPNLMVKDVNKTVDFYTNILGFNKIDSVPETGQWVFAIVKSGDVMFMFQEENSIKEEYPQLSEFPRGGGLTFYIHVSDIHTLYEKLKNKATLAKDLHDTFYGSTDFAIEDCNGYILTFSQSNK